MRTSDEFPNTIAFDDRAVRRLQRALDEAWRELRGRHLGDPSEARRHLARRIMARAAAGETNVIRLREYALLPYLRPVS